jgi:hypothetical protein
LKLHYRQNERTAAVLGAVAWTSARCQDASVGLGVAEGELGSLRGEAGARHAWCRGSRGGLAAALGFGRAVQGGSVAGRGQGGVRLASWLLAQERARGKRENRGGRVAAAPRKRRGGARG